MSSPPRRRVDGCSCGCTGSTWRCRPCSASPPSPRLRRRCSGVAILCSCSCSAARWRSCCSQRASRRSRRARSSRDALPPSSAVFRASRHGSKSANRTSPMPMRRSRSSPPIARPSSVRSFASPGSGWPKASRRSSSFGCSAPTSRSSRCSRSTPRSPSCAPPAFFAPAGIGVQDVGYLAVLNAYGVPDANAIGPAFVVLKRMKELVFVAFGYALFVQRPQPAATQT